MTDTKHTPGPWGVSHAGATTNKGVHTDGFFIGTEDGQMVCDLYFKTQDGGLQQFVNAEANARLIAAAPDLLEALEDALVVLETDLSNAEYECSFTTFSPKGGMTLRDWFAGQALAGFSALQSFYDDTDYDIAAKNAYLQADAVLKARES